MTYTEASTQVKLRVDLGRCSVLRQVRLEVLMGSPLLRGEVLLCVVAGCCNEEESTEESA